MTSIEADDAAVEALGWVRDMYAWSFAAARTGIKHELLEPPKNPLMVQPPSDTCVPGRVCACGAARADGAALFCRSLGEAAILHYTWGPVVYNKSDVIVWEARAPRRALRAAAFRAR